MKTKVVTGSPAPAPTLQALQEQLAALNDRVADLEARMGQSQANGQALAEGATPAPAEPLDEDLLVVISAAIAAFLGKKPRIRQIRLVSSATWAQQGRVGIHASHAFAVQSRSGAPS